MAHSALSGPVIVYGVAGTSTGGEGAQAGPGISYQGDALLDPRFPYAPGANNPAAVGIYMSPYPMVIDAIPSTIADNNIAASQSPGAAALTLVSTSGAGIFKVSTIIRADNSSFTPSGGTALAIDGPYSPLQVGALPATTTLTSSVNSSTTSIPVTSAAAFSLVVPYFIQIDTEIMLVTSISSNTLTATRGALGTTGAAHANAATVMGLAGSNPGGNTSTSGGDFVEAIFDPSKAIARALRITSGGDDHLITFNVVGYDLYGAPMHENITGTNGSIATGLKAWKYVTSITPSAAAAGTVKVGTSDIYGFPLRVDRFEYCQVYWATAFITASTGFVGAIATSPSTAVLGDVRGTYAVQGTASDGTRRLGMYVNLTANNALMATTANSASLFGTTQF